MSLSAAVIRELVAAGLAGDALVTACERIEASDPPFEQDPRTARQKRNARYYERKASEKRLNASYSDVSDGEPLSPKKEIPPTPPKEKITPIPISPVGSARAQFIEFWNLFPNKVGKRAAEREFTLALQRSSFDEIMAGLRRYVDKRDDRPWCNPSTFLHQDRWADQPADVVPQRRSTAPPAHQGDGYNAVLNKIINGQIDEHPGPTIDASYDRADSGGPTNLVQFNAVSKGH